LEFPVLKNEKLTKHFFSVSTRHKRIEKNIEINSSRGEALQIFIEKCVT
jgi:hypothetical protein